MIVRKFMQWVQTASASQRADGASALARAFLYADLDAEQMVEAQQALTSLLDDASPLVPPGACRKLCQRRRGAASYRLGARRRSIRYFLDRARAFAAFDRFRTDRLRRHWRCFRAIGDRSASAPFGTGRGGHRGDWRTRGFDLARGQSRCGTTGIFHAPDDRALRRRWRNARSAAVAPASAAGPALGSCGGDVEGAFRFRHDLQLDAGRAGAARRARGARKRPMSSSRFRARPRRTGR